MIGENFEIIVSTLKPDIVIIDQKTKFVGIFELTVPGETRIREAHRLKSEKYQHFRNDINSHTVSILPFEIGSHTGFISRDNMATLNTLHKFCTKDIKLKQFTKNISSITVLSSYYIFNCRNENDRGKSSHILSPFPNQWTCKLCVKFVIPAGRFAKNPLEICINHPMWKYVLFIT